MIHSLCLEGINSLFEETRQEANNSQGRAIRSPIALSTVNPGILGRGGGDSRFTLRTATVKNR